jgi:hypothetical protein
VALCWSRCWVLWGLPEPSWYKFRAQGLEQRYDSQFLTFLAAAWQAAEVAAARR